MQWGQDLAAIEDSARKGSYLEKKIKLYQVEWNVKMNLFVSIDLHALAWLFQDAISSLEVCKKPVIVATHSACIGAGVSLVSAADIRYCTNDAWFTVKEIELGLAADVGALQRCSKVIGNQSLVRELCFTGRKFDSKEALSCGFVNRVKWNFRFLFIDNDVSSKSYISI